MLEKPENDAIWGFAERVRPRHMGPERMIPKKPAPDLDPEGGNRFSEKIMRKLKKTRLPARPSG